MIRIALFVLAFGMMLSGVAFANQPSLEDFYRAQHKAVQFTPPAVSQSDAQAEQEKPVAGSHVVTSVSTCFEDLGPDESAEIKRNSLTPYADCQKRLRDRAIEKKADKKEAQAETPRNYKRVIEEDVDAQADSDEDVAPKPAKKK